MVSKMSDEACVFCEIAAGRAPADVIHRWPDVLAIIPLDPVVTGHTLIIPRVHVPDFTTDPEVSALTMKAASVIGRLSNQPMNLITSRGRAATQSVFHLHLHLLPRAPGDGLALPWYSGRHRPKRDADRD
jgi:histidine triad (HIT) family protein